MKLYKTISIVLGSVLLVGVIAFVSLATFVSPNRFKPVLITQVKKLTGRDLTMDGDLSWTLYPNLGVKVGHLTLNNSTEFKEKIFAEIDNATITVKLVPLIHSKVESSGITIHGLKLNLIKNAQGKTNWEDLHNHPSSTSTTTVNDASLTNMQKTSLGIAVSGIDISKANINWLDEATDNHISIQDFELHAKNITLTKPFPVQAKFNFVEPAANLSGNVSLASKISVDLQNQIYTLATTKLAAVINQGKKNFAINLNSDITNTANEKIAIENIIGNIANLTLTGKMQISNLASTPNLTGNLQIAPFDVKKWLQSTGQDVATLQTLRNLSGNVTFTATDSLKSVNLQSDMTIDEIEAAKMHITKINVKARLANGILNLAPITAEFYQGVLNGNSKVNFNSTAPQINLQAKLTQVQAAPLLADLGASHAKLKFSGTGNVDLQMTTSGANSDAIIKNLNGSSHLNFTNGTLEGIDIGYWVDSAYALADKSISPGANTEKTQFGTLNATAVIHNGVIKNNDLTISSPRFTSKGEGNIDLVADTLKYRIQTTSKQNENKKNDVNNMYGLPIPILIVGDLSNPSIRLDTDVLMKAIAAHQIEKVKADVQEKIAEKIKDKIPGKAGELLKNFLGQ